MKIIIHITGLSSVDVGALLIQRLGSVYPQGVLADTMFSLELPEDDARAQTVIALLRSHGLSVWHDHARERIKDKEYVVHRWHEYDETDLATVPYMLVHPTHQVEGNGRDSERRLVLGPRYLTRRSKLFTSLNPGMARRSTNEVVVSQNTRQLLEAFAVPGVVFRDTVLYDDRDGPPEPVRWGSAEFPDEWWELTSDLMLPTAIARQFGTEPSVLTSR